MRRRHLPSVALAALGALAGAACQPVASPPPPPPTVRCQEARSSEGKTDYFAVVDEADGSTRAVTFDAANEHEKQADLAAIEATEGDVIAVEVDQPVYAAVNPDPSDDERYQSGTQWGVDAAGFPTAWDGTHAASQGIITGTSTRVRVAVLDTGVHATHEDLNGPGVSTGAVVPGADEVGSGDGTTDPHGHGTHVAGILGARDNDLGGIGGAPDVEIYPIRVLNSCGSGSYASVINGIDDAIAAGAKVISMSLGGGSPSSGLADAVGRAQTAGIVVVAAAGNNGTTAPSYPAAITGVISVAATVQFGTALAAYSQRGSNVDIAAPGHEIDSTLNTGDYGPKNGTSMATPFVAAAAALLIAKCPGITPPAVESRLESTATPLAGNPIQTSPSSGALRADLATAGPC